MLPDEDFLVDRLPDHSSVLLCSACSGHGFKFAPAIGELVADLADGAEAHSRFSYRPGRFAHRAHAA
jgi:glycine/D-amino acid oxidase-like deaminating enzyme